MVSQFKLWSQEYISGLTATTSTCFSLLSLRGAANQKRAGLKSAEGAQTLCFRLRMNIKMCYFVFCHSCKATLGESNSKNAGAANENHRCAKKRNIPRRPYIKMIYSLLFIYIWIFIFKSLIIYDRCFQSIPKINICNIPFMAWLIPEALELLQFVITLFLRGVRCMWSAILTQSKSNFRSLTVSLCSWKQQLTSLRHRLCVFILSIRNISVYLDYLHGRHTGLQPKCLWNKCNHTLVIWLTESESDTYNWLGWL